MVTYSAALVQLLESPPEMYTEEEQEEGELADYEP